MTWKIGTVPIFGRGGPERTDRFAAELRGFGPVGLAAILVIALGNAVFVPLTALLVLAWAWRSRTPWRDIGLAGPRSWAVTILIGIAFGAAFKLAMKALVMPLLGAPPINPAYHYLAGNTAALPGALYLILIGAGFGEEVFFRGFLFERLGRLLGASPAAKAAAVLVTSVWFGLDHLQVQGIAGMEQALIVGLVFGTIYALTGRLWLLIVAHAAFDLTALAIIYWDIEEKVATYVFG
jgi:membrane protease YdiL (CAAX protease family)